MRQNEPEESEKEMARLGLLLELLEQRGTGFYAGEEKDDNLTEIIDFLFTHILTKELDSNNSLLFSFPHDLYSLILPWGSEMSVASYVEMVKVQSRQT